MGFLSRRKNKKYNYKPRYYKGEGSPFELKHKFDDYRSTVSPAKGLKAKFNAAIEDSKQHNSSIVNKRILLIMSVLILLFLWIIDFDLTIFLPNRN